jgi:hypothetical protein
MAKREHHDTTDLKTNGYKAEIPEKVIHNKKKNKTRHGQKTVGQVHLYWKRNMSYHQNIQGYKRKNRIHYKQHSRKTPNNQASTFHMQIR